MRWRAVHFVGCRCGVSGPRHATTERDDVTCGRCLRIMYPPKDSECRGWQRYVALFGGDPTP